jgi:cyclopropane-fatty-acyl-phospholipid synthase
MWVAYLAGVSVGFEYGPLHVFQTVATRQGEALPPLPPTREDVYCAFGPVGGMAGRGVVVG